MGSSLFDCFHFQYPGTDPTLHASLMELWDSFRKELDMMTVPGLHKTCAFVSPFAIVLSPWLGHLGAKPGECA